MSVAKVIVVCLSLLACSAPTARAAMRAARSPCSDIKAAYKDGQCCGSPGKSLGIPDLGNPTCADLKAAFKERVCCSRARVANLREALFDPAVEAKMSLEGLGPREEIVNEYVSNVGTPSPASTRNPTHTAILNFTHRNLPYAMYNQHLPTGNATTPPQTIAVTRGLLLERVDASLSFVNVLEFEKLEGRMGPDAGELFQGDRIKLFNRNGRNTITEFHVGVIDMRDPDRTFWRFLFAFTSDAMLNGVTAFFGLVRDTAMNFPGIEEVHFEMIPVADDSYDYGDYDLMPAA